MSENIDWILSGSYSLFIQGVDIEANDIDIVTNKVGAIKLDSLLSKYCIKPLEYSSTSEFRSYYGNYLIEGTKIDIMGEFQYMQKNGNWSKLRHMCNTFNNDFENMKLKLFPLEEELKEYEELGRVEKVNKIKEKLMI